MANPEARGQAPNTNTNPMRTQDRGRNLYPGHIQPVDYRSTSLEEAIANGWVNPAQIPGAVPPQLGSEPANFIENPHNLPPAQKKEKEGRTRGKKLLAGFLIGTGVLTAGGVASTAYVMNKFAGGSDKETSAPYNPGETNGSIDYSKVDPNTLTVEQFYDDATYPEPYRIRWANKIIQERATPQKIAEMNALMARANKRPLGEIVPASEKNTGDQILAQQSLAGYIASTDPNPTTGRKLLAGFLSPDNPGFETAKGQIGGGQDPVAATYYVTNGKLMTGDPSSIARETPTFYQTAINNYTPNGIPSKFMKIQNTVNNRYSEVTVRFFEGSWQTVDSIPENSPNWIMNPQEMTVK